MKAVDIKEIYGVLERIGALLGLDVDGEGAAGTLPRRAGKRHHRGQDDRGVLARAGLAERRHRAITGVPTGFTEFDRKTAGLQRGDLVVVAGRPSMGKTAFAMNLVEEAAGIPRHTASSASIRRRQGAHSNRQVGRA